MSYFPSSYFSFSYFGDYFGVQDLSPSLKKFKTKISFSTTHRLIATSIFKGENVYITFSPTNTDIDPLVFNRIDVSYTDPSFVTTITKDVGFSTNESGEITIFFDFLNKIGDYRFVLICHTPTTVTYSESFMVSTYYL